MPRTTLRWIAMLAFLLPALSAAPLRAELPERTFVLRDACTVIIAYPGSDDPKITLDDILKGLTKLYHKSNCTHLTFKINEDAFKAEEVMDVGKTEVANPALPPMKASLGRVLSKILERVQVPSRATYIIRKDHIEITTQQAIADEFFIDKRAKRNPEDSERVELLPLVIASFAKYPLDQALQEIAETTGENVVLDLRTRRRGKAPVTADFMNVPIDRVVPRLARQANLDCVHTGRVYYVTSKENAGAHRARLVPRKAERQNIPDLAP